MVNLMFGANAPKLTRMISDELKIEQAVIAGEKQRDTVWEVTDLFPDEKVLENIKILVLVTTEELVNKWFQKKLNVILYLGAFFV